MIKKLVNNEKSYPPSHYLVYIILFIAIIILLSIIQLRSKYSIQYNWWDTYDGKIYEKYLNFTNLLMIHENIIIYYFTKLFGTGINNLDSNQAGFLFQSVLPYILISDKNSSTGFVLPRHLTRDIRFRQGDNPTFDLFLVQNNLNSSINLKYVAPGNDNTKQGTIEANNNGVYPAPNDTYGWRNKFVSWGVPWDAWVDENGLSVPILTAPMVDVWFDQKQHPDNFLALYNILPDSPLCVSFINGSYNDNKGLILDAESLQILLGGVNESVPGGWVGYLIGLGNNNNNKYSTYMSTKYIGKIPKPPAPKCQNNTPAGWANAIGSGLGVAGIAAMIGFETVTAGLGSLFFIGAGIGLGIANSPPVNNSC